MPRTMITALGTTTMAAAAAVVWWAVSPTTAGPGQGGGPSPSTSGSPHARAAADYSVVCVGPDRVLRAPAEGACPTGHQSLNLEPEDSGTCEFCDPFKGPTPPDPSGDKELDALEQRVAALENAAYFEVVNKAGQPVFSVAPGGLRFYNNQAGIMAVFGASGAGGHFTARSGSTFAKVTLGVSGETAGLRVTEDGLVRMDLTTRDGRSSLRMPSGNGLIAGLGESATGTGAMLLGTGAGAMRVSFTVPEAGGMITVNGGGNGGLSLSEARIGGGLLDLADAQGDSVVRMGHVQNRYGIVLTGPVPGFPLVPKSGLPGSYFLGCGSAAPPACVPAIQ